MHTKGKARLEQANENGAAIRQSIVDYKETFDCQVVAGLEGVPEKVQERRAETLEVIIKAGIPVAKIDKLRPWLERVMGVQLTNSKELMRTYLVPLIEKERKELRTEFKGQLVGIYHDGTTHCGEAFANVWRAITEDFEFRLRCVRVKWLRGSMNADGISAELLSIVGSDMYHPLVDVLAWQHDCVAANLASYRDTLAAACPYSDDNGCLPHTGGHVGEHLETPTLDELLGHYNIIVGQSNYACVEYTEICGVSPKKKSGTRWWSCAFRPPCSRPHLLALRSRPTLAAWLATALRDGKRYLCGRGGLGARGCSTCCSKCEVAESDCTVFSQRTMWRSCRSCPAWRTAICSSGVASALRRATATRRRQSLWRC